MAKVAKPFSALWSPVRWIHRPFKPALFMSNVRERRAGSAARLANARLMAQSSIGSYPNAGQVIISSGEEPAAKDRTSAQTGPHPPGGQSPTTNLQVVNHFSKAGVIVSKVGLCRTIRELAWYEAADWMTFYPRCFDLSDTVDRDAFMQVRFTGVAAQLDPPNRSWSFAGVAFMQVWLLRYAGVAAQLDPITGPGPL